MNTLQNGYPFHLFTKYGMNGIRFGVVAETKEISTLSVEGMVTMNNWK